MLLSTGFLRCCWTDLRHEPGYRTPFNAVPARYGKEIPDLAKTLLKFEVLGGGLRRCCRTNLRHVPGYRTPFTAVPARCRKPVPYLAKTLHG